VVDGIGHADAGVLPDIEFFEHFFGTPARRASGDNSEEITL
jgi:hypothetical protein